MLDRMSASELAQWELMECIEPYGERAAWIRHAVLCALLVNINTPEGKPRATIEDFLPRTFIPKETDQVVNAKKIKQAMMLLMEKQNQWVAEQESQGNA
jgi:hypothetical protein